jgi:hypothetical protein
VSAHRSPPFTSSRCTERSIAPTEARWRSKYLTPAGTTCTKRSGWIRPTPPNFISADEGLARLRASYGEDKFGQLVALKRKFDPENVFSLNQNIPPDLAQCSPSSRSMLSPNQRSYRAGVQPWCSVSSS